MQCLKCGKKAAEKQVFCDECLEATSKYPVKPGTAVHLPSREKRILEKKQQPYPQEETPMQLLAQQRRLIRWLLWVTAILSLLLVLTVGVLIQTLDKEAEHNAIGKNYTTIDSGRRP